MAMIALLASCSKKNDFPEIPVEQTFANNFFKDANLAVTFIEFANAPGKVTIDFGTAYEKNISKIEVMGGDSPNYLCVISTSTNNGDVTQAKSYSVIDASPKAQTMYYAIRYTLTNGTEVYTSTFKFVRGK